MTGSALGLPLTLAFALGTGLVAVGVAVLVLGRLREPVGSDAIGGDPDLDAKPPYRSLRRPSFLIALGGLAAAVTGLALLRLEPVQWAPWLVLAVLGTLLAMVDAATTWLPNAVMHPFWIAMAAATLVVIALGGGRVAWPVLVGGVAWAVVFWLVWALSRRQIGFGDVRFALGLGAAAGAAGWATIYTCLFAGTLVGALWGVLHRLRHGPTAGPFPYGLALYLGCALGLALTPR